MATLDDLKIDGVSASLPPKVTYYNNRVSPDYNAVKGRIIQWENGLMIITGAYDLGDTRFGGSWGVFRECNSEQYLPHFEVPFIEPPIITMAITSEENSNLNAAFIEAIDNLSTTRAGTAFFCAGTSGTKELAISFIAIGMWK